MSMFKHLATGLMGLLALASISIGRGPRAEAVDDSQAYLITFLQGAGPYVSEQVIATLRDGVMEFERFGRRIRIVPTDSSDRAVSKAVDDFYNDFTKNDNFDAIAESLNATVILGDVYVSNAALWIQVIYEHQSQLVQTTQFVFRANDHKEIYVPAIGGILPLGDLAPAEVRAMIVTSLERRGEKRIRVDVVQLGSRS